MFFLIKGGVDFLFIELVDLECIVVFGGFIVYGIRLRDQFYFIVFLFLENNEFSFVVVCVVNDWYMNKSRFVDYDVIIVFYENDV